MIELRDICKVYQTTEIVTDALVNVNLTVDKQEFLSIQGPSGCGKSSLIKIIAMMESPSSGIYSIDGKPINALSVSERSRLRRKNVGFVFQDFKLLKNLTVKQNIMVALIDSDGSSQEKQSAVEKVMNELEIAHRANHYPGEISGGTKQRVALARALVNKPRLLLADEPTGNLDSRNAEEVMNILQSANNNGCTIIMVTHSEYCAEFSTRRIQILDGMIVQ